MIKSLYNLEHDGILERDGLGFGDILEFLEGG
jgi:hypothetical protein